MSAPRATRGMTLIEIAISVAILAVIMVAAMSLLVSTQRAALSSGAALELDEATRRAIAELRRELRQSGWEAESAGGTNKWQGNQCVSPVPLDGPPDPGVSGYAGSTAPGWDTGGDPYRSTPYTSPDGSSFGTAGTAPDPSLLKFRIRDGLQVSSNSEIDNWHPDGVGANSDYRGYIVYALVPDGQWKNVKNGPIPRFKLARFLEDKDGSRTQQGIVIQNLESAVFKRLDWDLVEVQLTFLKPDPAWEGTAPEPLRRKVVEQLQMLNGSINTN